MSLRASPDSAIPEETVRVAHAVFPKGTVFMRMRDELALSIALRNSPPCFPIPDSQRKPPPGWRWYWCCSLPKGWPTARRPMPCAVAWIGNMPSGSN